jgi:8-oxo-dGTP pyrophosphatase MutT (NUDIX family)
MIERDGERWVMLITSRETQRWIIPKGWEEADLRPHQVAAKEAYEEAGLVGEIGTAPIASYRYQKRLSKGRVRTCHVEVFPLAVIEQLEDWPEREERRTAWFTPSEAATQVTDEGLERLLRSMAENSPEQHRDVTVLQGLAAIAP